MILSVRSFVQHSREGYISGGLAQSVRDVRRDRTQLTAVYVAFTTERFDTEVEVLELQGAVFVQHRLYQRYGTGCIENAYRLEELGIAVVKYPFGREGKRDV